MATARTFTAGRFVLKLDGVECGFVKSIGGGDAAAGVVEERVGGSFFAKKRLGLPKYEEFAAEIGLAMAQPLYEWIAASWQGTFFRKDGSIVVADMNLKAQSERQFFQALLTETTVPALDASAKDAGYLTIKFVPELAKTVKASGTVGGGTNQKQKAFVPSHFRLELDGVDCTHVAKIDAFTVRHAVAADEVGASRDPERQPTTVEFPNLRVSLADGPSAAGWQAWADDFIVQGNNDDSKEKSGAIVFLGPDMKAELGRIVLHNVGICALRSPVRDARADAVRRLSAELYCERMEFQLAGHKPPAPELRRRVVGIRG